MTENTPVEFTEDRVPSDGIEETISELIELYGGDMTAARVNERQFVLPLRRGFAPAGGVECTLSWQGETEATVKLVCNRDVDAPKWQRFALLFAGAVCALMFTMWPFFAHYGRELGTAAIFCGLVAVAVYFLTLKRTSGGIAYDFLQRLAARQRDREAES